MADDSFFLVIWWLFWVVKIKNNTSDIIVAILSHVVVSLGMDALYWQYEIK